MRRRTAVGAAVISSIVLLAASASAAPPEAAVPTRGDLLAFTGWVPGDLEQSVLSVDTATGKVRTVAKGWAGALTWTPDGGRLVWIGANGRQDGGSTLFSARPDGSERRTLLAGSGVGAVATAPDGALAVVRTDLPEDVDCAAGAPPPRAEILLLAPDGSVRSLRDVPASAFGLVFSPDGSLLLWRAAVGGACDGGDYQVFLTDVADGATRQVAGDAPRSGWPTFSGDGRTVIAQKSDNHGRDLVRIDVATATGRRVLTPDFAEDLPTVSPDGTRLAFVRTPGVPDDHVVFRATGPARVVVTDLAGRLLLDLGTVPVDAEDLAWSPGGTYLVLGGSTFVPACEGCDYGSADPALWTFPLDGQPRRELTEAGGFAGAGLAFQPRFPVPPTVERATRRVRR